MLDLINSILILLAIAMGLGVIFDRYNLPEVVGAITAGIILGPAVLSLITPSAELSTLSILALFFIVLQIGIEASADIFSRNMGYITAFAITSFIVPFAIMSTGSFFIFGLPYFESVSVSLSVSIPSISITSVLLVRSGIIKLDDGLRLLGGVALSDVIGFIIFVSFHRAFLGLIADSASLVVFVILLYLLDNYLKSKSEHLVKGLTKFRGSGKESLVFAAVIMMGLAVSSLFEYIGITFVLGALFSGLIIHQNSVGEEIYGVLQRTFQRINNSFCIPLFFSISGLEVTLIPFTAVPYMIFLIAISSLIGGYFALQFSRKFMKNVTPQISLGIFGGRGAVGIIIASIALSDGFLSSTYYSLAIFSTVIMAVIFTFIFQRALNSNQTLQNDIKEAA